MSLDRECLPLEPSPRSVQQARHWTAAVVRALGRPDLTEAAELGVSELVTNALLHGVPPISLRLRGTRSHPRIEVADGSPEPPVPPDDALDPMLHAAPGDAGPAGARDTGGEATATDPAADSAEEGAAEPSLPLTTLGRGLGIVSMCARAWGADIRREGKVVWFEPADDPATGEPTRAAIVTHADDLEPVTPDEPLTSVVLRRVPLALYAGFRQHFSELRRELRLLALAHESEYPLASDLGSLLGEFETRLRHSEADEALAAHPPDLGSPGAALPTGVRDLSMLVPPSMPYVVTRLLELLDLADAFCRAERLLALARTPVQRTFQRWFLSEVARQVEGAEPRPWARKGASVDQTAS